MYNNKLIKSLKQKFCCGFRFRYNKGSIMRSYRCAIVLFFILGAALAAESYLDYGEENADRNIENLREFYRYLLRRNSLEGLRSSMSLDSPYEHLMIRKSQRSPSLRLRFGRSDPMMPKGNLLTRSASNPASFEDN
ncbi:Similar to EAG_11010: Short neuropeptide F (Camponotus floridanus) [Cotesia congregata]|uniref:Similar to EAG_11010: Short neuropeptide F (Camponotus floridanus) n=1 Tax=Cotesia congregata TaxID=51543 RepID=A0A8J2HRS1_COTCN|nr:Similar to EAG_11010: Short neuropeptide F (Camponotus floridanus) [Cotesia congregata]